MKWDKKLDRYVVKKTMHEQKERIFEKEIDRIFLILSIIGYSVLLACLGWLGLK